MNKIISRIVHDWLEGYMPNLISANQSEFVKGRSVSKNVLLAQKIIMNIKKRSKVANVVIKLDMDKAYDRVEWDFLIVILSEIGFHKIFTNKLWRLIANNWYSILINGQTCGFFNSTRGVKIGRYVIPLSSHSSSRGPF